MAGPVDTDALRDKAVWLGHLDREFGEQVATAADEVDRLRAVIENAPHADDCCYLEEDAVSGLGCSPHAHCTCWKLVAL